MVIGGGGTSAPSNQLFFNPPALPGHHLGRPRRTRRPASARRSTCARTRRGRRSATPRQVLRVRRLRRRPRHVTRAASPRSRSPTTRSSALRVNFRRSRRLPSPTPPGRLTSGRCTNEASGYPRGEVAGQRRSCRDRGSGAIQDPICRVLPVRPRVEPADPRGARRRWVAVPDGADTRPCRHFPRTALDVRRLPSILSSVRRGWPGAFCSDHCRIPRSPLWSPHLDVALLPKQGPFSPPTQRHPRTPLWLRTSNWLGC